MILETQPMVDVNEASRHGKGMEVVENGDEGYDSGG